MTPSSNDILKRVNRKHRKSTGSWLTFSLVFLAVLIANVIGIWEGRRYQRAHTPPSVVVRTSNPRTGEWESLDTSKRPVLNLYCGNAVGGYACEINRVQDGMADGTGVLLVPSAPIPDISPGAPVPPTRHREKHESDGISRAENL